jgi:hypothetical protein
MARTGLAGTGGLPVFGIQSRKKAGERIPRTPSLFFFELATRFRRSGEALINSKGRAG